MIKFVLKRFFYWMKYEPVIGLLMIIAAVVLFLTAFRKRKPKDDASFWQWTRSILEAVGTALLFLGLLWAFRSILNDNYRTFRRTHGRVSSVNYQSVKTIWGRPHRQKEIKVYHYIEKEFKKEIRRSDPTLPPIYKIVKKKVNIEQNSILSSKGYVEMILNKRKKGSAYYSGYEAKFFMEYEIINDSEHKTQARFYFPRSARQVLTENFNILENGKNISRNLRFYSRGVSWKREMKPGEKIIVTVSFTFRGIELFYYQIPTPREIKNFEFKLIAKGISKSEINYPEGCITPKQITKSKDGNGVVLKWTLDKSITTAGMGISLPKPGQPGARVSRVLANSPYALMILIVTIFLSFLILNFNIDFLRISLLAGAYSVMFMLMSSLSDFLLGFWGTLILGAIIVTGLSYLLYRKHESNLLKVIILALTGFFSFIYPLIGLLSDYRESFKGIVVIVIIMYLFFISLYSRVKKTDDLI